MLKIDYNINLIKFFSSNIQFNHKANLTAYSISLQILLKVLSLDLPIRYIP